MSTLSEQVVQPNEMLSSKPLGSAQRPKSMVGIPSTGEIRSQIKVLIQNSIKDSPIMINLCGLPAELTVREDEKILPGSKYEFRSNSATVQVQGHEFTISLDDNGVNTVAIDHLDEMVTFILGLLLKALSSPSLQSPPHPIS